MALVFVADRRNAEGVASRQSQHLAAAGLFPSVRADLRSLPDRLAGPADLAPGACPPL